MNHRTLLKPLVLACGVLFVAIAAVVGFRAWGRAGAEAYRTFDSPDRRFQIIVYRKPGRSSFPGQASDAPGYFQLRDSRKGRVLRERAVELVQLMDRIEWSVTSVEIKLLADWSLPQ